MKIALCLSGGLRNFKDTAYSFKNHLLDKHQVDVFFFGLENKDGSIQNQKDFIELYQPKKLQINTKDYYNNILCNYHLPTSYYGFYNVMKCNDLKKQYEQDNSFKYDIVIRSRTDFFWFRDLTTEELELSKDYVLTPSEWSFRSVHDFCRSDVFAIGNSELIDEYSELFNYIDEYCKIFTFHPESLCGYHLQDKKIPNLEVERCVVFEYPTKRGEKYIHPHKFSKTFEEPDIEDEGKFLLEISSQRKNF
jgi:hypothetical protein